MCLPCCQQPNLQNQSKFIGVEIVTIVAAVVYTRKMVINPFFFLTMML
ncbi:hypothetical protein Goshw_023723 [Gossypium schwendimanii]|uniref:Uncharacterized protein n=1 Tax=Gossypium schwendimanii TaxID=34291 RepID=A0A7J9N5G0_GOSSC|nr:hypothetical protein [Gossypium schwendimanii]